MQTRFFNHITYDNVQKTVTKTSLKPDMLREEILWYQDLPHELHSFIPEIRQFSLDKEVHLSMAYVEGPSLGETYVSQDKTVAEWEGIFEDFQNLLRRFAQYPATITAGILYKMYFQKTEQRVTEVLRQNKLIQAIYNRGHFQLNGMTMLCPIKAFRTHLDEFKDLLKDPIGSIIHGDLNLSNIFYFPDTRKMKLIDPRGRFGNIGIYGDQRYDLAKIRHSLSGYEHIVRGKYQQNINGYEIDFKIGLTADHAQIRQKWDTQLGSLLKSIKLIEALLFLSMLPLHSDSQARQLAIFSQGTLLILNVREKTVHRPMQHWTPSHWDQHFRLGISCDLKPTSFSRHWNDHIHPVILLCSRKPALRSNT